MLKRGLTIFFGFFMAISGLGQNQVSESITLLAHLWDENQPIRFEGLIVDSSYQLKADPFKLQADTRAERYRSLLLASNRTQQRIQEKNVGLHATLSYQENLNTPLFDPEDFIIFKRRAIAGVDWDLLNNGLYENRLRAKVLKLEEAALKRQAMDNNLGVLQAASTEQIIRYFNEKKIQVLDRRKKLNAKQLEIAERLWATRDITRDDYLKAIQNTTDIRAQYNLYQNYNLAPLPHKASFDFELPILDIDINALFLKAQVPFADSTPASETEKFIKYQSSYFRDVSLKAYTRYNYYYLINSAQSSRSYVSVGMNLSMPISFNQREKKTYYALQQQLANMDVNAAEQTNLQALLLNYYYEYQYKLKQFKNLYHKHLVYQELLRTERVNQELNSVEFNPNRALLVLDDSWSNVIELLDLKQELYKILLAIKLKTPSVDLKDYTTLLTLDNLDIEASKPPYKAVYVWSDAFKNHAPEFIREYCSINLFNPVLISYKPAKAYVKQLNDFLAKSSGTETHLLIGSNKLLETGIKAYLDTLSANVNLQLVKGIHLDVEPHTLDGFKEDKQAFFDRYLAILKDAKRFADSKNMSLSVSIPLSYPTDVLESINQYCNEIYLMAYERPDAEFIMKKTEEEKAIFKDKCVLALRTQDFKNRLDMDLFFEKCGFGKTAYHDLDDLIQFDNTSINREESNYEKR